MNSPESAAGGDPWGSRRVWSLWELMNLLHAGALGSAFAKMLQISQLASSKPSDEPVSDQLRTLALDAAHSAMSATAGLGLAESRDALARFEDSLGSPALPNKAVDLDLHGIARLMQSELEKLQAFALEKETQKYFRNEGWETGTASALPEGLAPKPLPLFTRRAQDAFPSTLMDLAEAGRCLALGRNNAAIYHLMQVAEIGLRVLAHDRRVSIQRGKARTEIPLDFAQWGEIIGELEKAKGKINGWKRSKAVREQAIQFYASAIFEVSSFNEIWRKHIAHARGKKFEDDTAISCWGHVYRFMDKLSEYMSEGHRTPIVWNATT